MENDASEEPVPSLAKEPAVEGNRLSDLAKHGLFSVLSLYFITVVLAIPYFNWQYAKKNGFLSWLFFGEVVATAKAVVWPYYAFAGQVSAAEDSHDRAEGHFANSRRASHEALTIVSRFDGVMALPAKEIAEVVKLLEASVAEAELVDDSFLDKVHPEFRQRFREEYTASLRNLAHGLQASDKVKLILAVSTYNSFSDWASSHNDELKFP